MCVAVGVGVWRTPWFLFFFWVCPIPDRCFITLNGCVLGFLRRCLHIMLGVVRFAPIVLFGWFSASCFSAPGAWGCVGLFVWVCGCMDVCASISFRPVPFDNKRWR